MQEVPERRRDRLQPVARYGQVSKLEQVAKPGENQKAKLSPAAVRERGGCTRGLANHTVLRVLRYRQLGVLLLK